LAGSTGRGGMGWLSGEGTWVGGGGGGGWEPANNRRGVGLLRPSRIAEAGESAFRGE